MDGREIDARGSCAEFDRCGAAAISSHGSGAWRRIAGEFVCAAGGATRDASLAAEGKEFAVNAFVHIGADESVTVISAHSEMGQGVYTSLAMLLNEELQADWAKVRVEAAPVDTVYNHPVFGMQMTGGSTTSPSEWVRYRKMGALARTMLVEAAAKRWNVPASGVHGGERRGVSRSVAPADDLRIAGECGGAIDGARGRDAEDRRKISR